MVTCFKASTKNMETRTRASVDVGKDQETELDRVVADATTSSLIVFFFVQIRKSCLSFLMNLIILEGMKRKICSTLQLI